ncbi:phospholipase D-like domain-containing protein [Labrys portucalensis]|uniref:Phospholipase D n=1 Tax=Labrys neptuniae TaxID=376174 RepID=A0ABV6ZSB8_9HYPH
MRIVQVAFPVLRGKRRFTIEKGRRWSIVEHLLLHAVSEKSASAEALENAACVPRRVIVEAFVRLMRAGWVEMISMREGTEFQATPIGRIQAKADDLPTFPLVQHRWLGFNVDQLTGTVFRGRELRLVHQNDLGPDVVRLNAANLHATGDMGDIFTALEGDDEVIVGVKASPERLLRRFALVTVRDSQKIDGLPSRAPQALQDHIREASQSSGGLVARPAASPGRMPVENSAGPTEGVFRQTDMIVDGAAHRDFLSRTIRNARERIIIHSTFINEHAFTFLPDLLLAAANGVRIDVFWGQDEDRNKQATSRAEAEKLKRAVAEKSRSDAIIIHMFSTGSHSKIVVSDDGRGGWFAAIGSCNWLGSPFESFEVSVKVRDPDFCGRIVRHLATMSMGREGIWHDLSTDITILGRRIEQAPRTSERKVPMKLLLAPDHAVLAIEASVKAKRRLFVTSHRIGVAGQPMVIMPAVAAARDNGITADLYFGKGTETLTATAAGALTLDLRSTGVRLRPVYVPRLHAKLLAWDDDALAITSQNWLSADPSDSSPLRELGLFINSPRIADQLIRSFQMRTNG